jgi:hypothetical protein
MTSFPSDTFTAADVAELVPKLWGDRINDFYKSKLVMANFFTDRSSELRGGGSALYTPNITEMTATAKSNGAAVTLSSPTETKITLTVDQWYEVSFNIEDKEAAQFKQSYYIQNTYAKNAGYSIAKVLEVAIATLFASFSQSVGASTTTVVDSDIRKGLGLLAAGNVDLDGVAFFFNEAVAWNQLMGLDKFTLVQNDASASPVNKGMIGKLYGRPVYTSNNITYVSSTTGRNNAIAHADAIHFATAPLGVSSKGGMVGAGGVRIQSNYVPQYLSTLTTADILYGVVENKDAAGIRFMTTE